MCKCRWNRICLVKSVLMHVRLHLLHRENFANCNEVTADIVDEGVVALLEWQSVGCRVCSPA